MDEADGCLLCFHLKNLSASMKYPEGRMSVEASMPISVQSWFGHELEIRGIDAVVYTRYIISLLKQDQVELDPGETDADHLWGRKYDLRRIRGKKSEKKKGQGVSEEDLKKSAAVECLMAISDEATDIEELVEELFIRLKEINAQKENREPPIDPSNQDSCPESSVTASACEDPAERYYAAFPALQGHGSQTQISPSQCDTSVWSKNPITSQLSEPSQDAQDDASEPCGQRGLSEAKSQRISQKTSSGKEGNNIHKKSAASKPTNNLKTNRYAHHRQGKSKKEKSLNRAARLLSWPPDVPKKPDNQRNDSGDLYPNHSKGRSKSQTRVGNVKNEGVSPRDPIASTPRGPKQSFRPSSRHVRGFSSSVSPELKEHESWYTQPLDGILSSIPDTKGRLFNRHSLSLSDQFSSGLPSSVESSPPESPNALLKSSVDDVWDMGDTEQFSARFKELSLPAFFMTAGDTEHVMPQQFSCLEQETWSFPFPDTPCVPGLSEPKIVTGATTTSFGCPLDDSNPTELQDISLVAKSDVTAEIHVNPIHFVDPLEEPCSQSSPSQYKAWGSLPLEMDDFVPNLSDSFVPSPPGSWASRKDVQRSSSDLTSPVDGQPYGLSNDTSPNFYSLSQLSSPGILKPFAEEALICLGDDFSCFLSESSVNLFGDLSSKPKQLPVPPTFLENSDFWAFTAPKKHGVFSAMLFTDLTSPVLSRDHYLVSSPWYWSHFLDDANLQKVWDSQHHLTCKASPHGSASKWFGAKTPDESILEDNYLQKVWNSQQYSCITSPLHLSLLGAIPEELPQSYIPFWFRDNEPVPAEITVEDHSDPQDTDQSDTMLQPCSTLWKHPRSVSLENLSKTVWEDGNLENTTQLSKSFELVPSEHSAFEDVVPRKLLHVLSEPIMKYCQTSPRLATGDWDEHSPEESDVGADSQEHLFFSSKTHFRPIQTPEDQTHGASPNEGVELHLKDLFGGHTATSKTPYQAYMGMENLDASFIPKFRVQKNSGKYVQTGQFVENIENEEGKEEEVSEDVIDDKLNIVLEVLGDIGESCDRAVASEWADGGESDTSDTVSAQFSEEEWNLRSLWKDNSEVEIRGNELIFQPTLPNKAYPISIWSTGEDTEIPPLPKIDLVNQGSYWPIAESPKEKSTEVGSVVKTALVSDSAGTGCLNSPASEDQDEDQSVRRFKLDPDLLNWTEFAPLPDQAVYSSELEQKWLNSEDNTSDVCSADNKTKKRRSWKPCSFFLEGHCRRSDCKFAHDMSSITCRFWEDGDCFKGSTCPFLHGYPSVEADIKPSAARNIFSEARSEDFSSPSKSDMPSEETANASLLKAMKRAAVIKKGWNTSGNVRGTSKQIDKDEREFIPRKN